MENTMTETCLAVFENQEFGQVRVITGQDNNPWFVAADVCAALKHSNSRMALAGLDDDERGVSKVYTPGGEQEMNIISEAGLYSLVLRSNLPEAKAFKRWITHEVLPAIRKSGMYAADKEIETARQLGRAEGAKAAMLLSPYDLEEMRRVLRYRERGFTKGETALVMHRAITRIDKCLRMASSLGILPPVNYSWRKPESMEFDIPVLTYNITEQ